MNEADVLDLLHASIWTILLGAGPAVAAAMVVGIAIALFQALMSLAPQIPDLIQAVETAISLLQSGTAPTAEQQAQIDAALDAANKAVQGA